MGYGGTQRSQLHGKPPRHFLPRIGTMNRSVQPFVAYETKGCMRVLAVESVDPNDKALLIYANPPSNLTPTPHHLERLLHANEWRVSITFVFDDVPLYARRRLANAENLFPRKFVVADERVGFGFRVGFYMDAGDTAGMLFQKYHRVSALGHSVASVELNDDFLLRSVKKRVPGQL